MEEENNTKSDVEKNFNIEKLLPILYDDANSNIVSKIPEFNLNNLKERKKIHFFDGPNISNLI